ncbi:MAG: hypothetical protein ACREBC_01375 [Pyrinomonadaceae bacterium]
MSSSPLIWEMIKSFLQWAESAKLRSYDWWDIWGTSFGSWAKTLYHKHRIAGTFVVTPIIFADVLYPGLRKFFAAKRSFPICYAHIGMAYVTLFEITKQQEYLHKAEALVTPLLNMASPHAHGLGWGINLNWTTVGGVIPPGTPCNTQTAYAYEFFKQLHDITGHQKYMEYLSRIAKHVAYDFPEWRIGDSLVCSYSTMDTGKVVNANSYRALMLIDAGTRFNDPEYLEKGIATLRYVLSMQGQDGSWPYSEYQPFIDNYHTCFIIKNLYKCKRVLGDTLGIENAVQRGLTYYFSYLFDKDGYPIPFAVKPRLTLYKYDSYDLAESIGLLAELDIEHKRLIQLIHLAKTRFQTKDGWFIFRRRSFPHLKGIPYIRYANSAMFLALTKVLKLERYNPLDDSAN